MRLLLENWRKYLKEGFIDDIISDLEKDVENRKLRPGRAIQAKKWKEDPPSTEADWEKFKRWKSDTEGEGHSAGTPEDFEKAKQQRDEAKPEETLDFNCNKMYKWLTDSEWRSIGYFGCRSLKEATQGLDPGSGAPNQIFTQSRYVKAVGEGAYGVAMLFSNGHIVKVFKGGIHGGNQAAGLKAELETYAKLLNSQFGGSAKSNDMAVYEYGTIPVYVPEAELKMTNPVEYLGYAEIGKVIPFESWVSDNFKEYAEQSSHIQAFFDNDIYDGMSTAAARSRMARDTNKVKRHYIKPFSEIEGGAEQYADYVIKWIKNRGLENSSENVQNYGWAQSDGVDADLDPLEIPPMPEALYSGRGAEFLKDFMIALYDLAKSSGDEYLYTRGTRDVHTGNFGISYQTGEVIIFDR